MSKYELYKVAFQTINPQKLRQFGTAGHVACALETIQGNIFTGICVDLPCSIGLCAEQAAISDMLKHRESQINMIIAVFEDGSILPPCGRCREFIVQINDSNLETYVILPEMQKIKLKDLLPERWDAKWN